MSNWFDDPRRPHNTRDPRPISPFTDSVGWSTTRPRPVQVGAAPAAPSSGVAPTLDALVAAPTAAPTPLDALVAGPSSAPTALEALVGTAPIARVALARRPVEAPATDDPACAPRMTMFQEKP